MQALPVSLQGGDNIMHLYLAMDSSGQVQLVLVFCPREPREYFLPALMVVLIHSLYLDREF